MTFPISGVETAFWVPILAGFVVSVLCSMGGISGAFLLLPFQVSVLGFVSPAASSTNLVYNLVGIPSGIYRYFREGRMLWPLATVIVLATIPGACLGVVIRIRCLPDPGAFKCFVGVVLLYIGVRLLRDVMSSFSTFHAARALPSTSPQGPNRTQVPGPALDDFAVRPLPSTWSRIAFRFDGETFSFSTVRLFLLALGVGLVSGTYGIGGGSLTGPILVTLFHLPVYTIAAAVLLGTLVTSVAGIVFYHVAAAHYADLGLAIAPDWLLGALFGIGGAVGMYVGARCQKYVPARIIKLILAAAVLFLAVRYVTAFFC
ncbi:MAG: sulfite exporter TauE/SafE family protein [Phycisphaerales bacterium]|nr:MAG: sulfite exporter TauE/SafE family protein [Phycisphaerales bacterium]